MKQFKLKAVTFLLALTASNLNAEVLINCRADTETVSHRLMIYEVDGGYRYRASTYDPKARGELMVIGNSIDRVFDRYSPNPSILFKSADANFTHLFGEYNFGHKYLKTPFVFYDDQCETKNGNDFIITESITCSAFVICDPDEAIAMTHKIAALKCGNTKAMAIGQFKIEESSVTNGKVTKYASSIFRCVSPDPAYPYLTTPKRQSIFTGNVLTLSDINTASSPE